MATIYMNGLGVIFGLAFPDDAWGKTETDVLDVPDSETAWHLRWQPDMISAINALDASIAYYGNAEAAKTVGLHVASTLGDDLGDPEEVRRLIFATASDSEPVLWIDTSDVIRLHDVELFHEKFGGLAIPVDDMVGLTSDDVTKMTQYLTV